MGYNTDMVELQLPSPKMVPSYLDFIEEMRSRGEKIWESLTPRSFESTTDFIDRLRRAETHPDQGLVPETTYWAIQQGQVVGPSYRRCDRDA
jgi:predicted acetyltransferase